MLNGQTSDWASVLAGVPQESILGPLLFLIYINDTVSNIGCSIRLFADDTSLYVVIECPNTAYLFNFDLHAINKWVDDWLVIIFSAIKTLSMIISKKLIPTLHPPLFMDKIQPGETEKHKHLGLTFTKDCDWSTHVANIATKASTRLCGIDNVFADIGLESLQERRDNHKLIVDKILHSLIPNYLSVMVHPSLTAIRWKRV